LNDAFHAEQVLAVGRHVYLINHSVNALHEFIALFRVAGYVVQFDSLLEAEVFELFF